MKSYGDITFCKPRIYFFKNKNKTNNSKKKQAKSKDNNGL